MTQINRLKTLSAVTAALLATALVWAQPLRVGTIENAGLPVNTPVDDFAPSFTADGAVMVFNSRRGNERYQNIYISYFNNNSWSTPVPVNEVNSPYNDETPFITPDGQYLFFASDRDGSIEMPGDRPGETRISYDIYVSKKINDRWDAPIRLPGAVNTAHHERSPSMSPDLSTLYYTTWAFGDIARTKIMKAEYRDGEFINPAPLPSPVNMNTQELGLTPSPDGKGIFFSSQRPGGYGGWDIYYSVVENGRFSEPVNLGPGINSKFNDAYLSIVNNHVYFCSNREGGYGMYDIYSASITGEETGLKLIVRDKKTGKPLSVELNLSTKIKKGDGETVTHELRKRTAENGEATIKHDPQVKDLDVAIIEKGYLPLFRTIDIPSAAGKPQLLELTPLEKEASFDIHSIHFDFESAKIKPESFPYLNALAEYLKSNPSLRFEIIGHTDLHGTDEFNNKLSLDRAQAVRDYLAARGIDKDRFTVRGAGKTEPRVPKLGPPHDEMNRRTEFKLLGK